MYFQLVQCFMQWVIYSFALIQSFGRSSINRFHTFSSRVSFSLCWALGPRLWFCDWNILLSAHCQKLVPSWQQYLQWIDTWTVYRDSPRVDMWNTIGSVSAETLRRGKNLLNSKTDTLEFFLPKILTRCKFSVSDSFAFYILCIRTLSSCIFFHFKIWHCVKFLIQNVAFETLKKFEKCKICGFQGAKRTEKCFFERTFFWKADMLKSF